MRKIKVFETFAGIGAQKKAIDRINNLGIFESLEFEISATSEWDVWANISYDLIHSNNKETKYSGVSIEKKREFLEQYSHSLDSKTSIKNLRKLNDDVINYLYASFKKNNNLGSILNITGEELIRKTGGIDLITYSFPCQDLSVAGKNKGMKNSDGTRSGLLWQIDRILSELEILNKLPKYLLLENVKNMLSKKHLNDYEEWLMNLKDKYGYNTQTYLLNAKNFGIPQNRERVFALSVRDDGFLGYIKNGKILFNPSDFEEWKKYRRECELSTFLKTNYKNNKYLIEAQKATPKWTLSREKMLKDNPILFSLNKKMDAKKICRTITTKQDRNPNAGIIDLTNTDLEINKLIINVTKSNYRFLTPRETFLLMGFENRDFDRISKNEVIGNKNEILYRQSGNSIVVDVIEFLFFKIAKLEEKNNA